MASASENAQIIEVGIAEMQCVLGDGWLVNGTSSDGTSDEEKKKLEMFTRVGKF